MNVIFGAAGTLIVATLTPGPNNFVVLRAARRGFAAAWPSIAGIVGGGIVLLAVVLAGAGPALAAVPPLRTLFAVASCAYLALLGARLLASGIVPAASADENAETALPSGVVALFGFQFVNPKAWALMLAVTTALPAEVPVLTAFVQLLPAFVVIPTASLVLWAAFGAASAKAFARHPWALRLQSVLLGLLLIVSAGMLLQPLWRLP